MHAFNRNGLFIFILANLLTGLVNMTVSNLEAGRGAAMSILLGYMTALTTVAVGFDARGISIKL